MSKTKTFFWFFGPMLFVLGFLIFGGILGTNGVYASTFYECTCETSEVKVGFNSVYQGQKYGDFEITDKKFAEAALGESCAGGTVKCFEKSFEVTQSDPIKGPQIKCQNNINCPSGYKCDISAGGSGMCVQKSCSNNTDCSSGETCSEVMGCVPVASKAENEACVCAHGELSCKSLMCSASNETGECMGTKCQKKGGLSQDTGCVSHKECWDKGISACCVSSQCTGPIGQCKNENCGPAGTGGNQCPPGYLCDTDFQACRLKACTIASKRDCATDADCQAKGINAKCVLLDDISASDLGTTEVDKGEMIKACQDKKITGKCVFAVYEEEKKDSGTSPFDLSWWPAKGRLQALIGAKLIPWIMGMVGLLCVVILIIGGQMYMISAGNEKNMEAAKKMIKAAVVGLFFTLVAYIFVELIIGIFT